MSAPTSRLPTTGRDFTATGSDPVSGQALTQTLDQHATNVNAAELFRSLFFRW